jgi:hypothetical protein
MEAARSAEGTDALGGYRAPRVTTGQVIPPHGWGKGTLKCCCIVPNSSIGARLPWSQATLIFGVNQNTGGTGERQTDFLDGTTRGRCSS